MSLRGGRSPTWQSVPPEYPIGNVTSYKFVPANAFSLRRRWHGVSRDGWGEHRQFQICNVFPTSVSFADSFSPRRSLFGSTFDTSIIPTVGDGFLASAGGGTPPLQILSMHFVGNDLCVVPFLMREWCDGNRYCPS